MDNYNLEPVSKEKRIVINSTVPPDLIGKFYLLNGSNPYLKNVENHLFDGDGMIHSLHFEKDKIIYHNKWIRTHRFKLEKKYKKPLFVRLANLNTIEIFTKFFNKLLLLEDTGITDKYGEGTANTNIIYHAGKLFALNEMDKPYLLTLKNGIIKTIGRYDFNGKLTHNINAHPKIDFHSQKMYTLGYDVIKNTSYISVIDRHGDLLKTINVPLTGSSIIHDVGITKHKIIILDLSLEFSLSNVLFANFPIHVNKQRVSRIGILSKKSDKLIWIPLSEPEVIFHIVNSWEENGGKTIIMYAFSYDTENFDIKHLQTQRPKLKKFIIDITTKSCKSSFVSHFYGEFPVIKDNQIGKPIDTFYYSRISDTGFDAIIKHNVHTQQEDVIPFPKDTYGNECAIWGDYILNVVYCTETKHSRLLIYHLNSLSLISDIDLRCRIPFGFHCKIIEFS